MLVAVPNHYCIPFHYCSHLVMLRAATQSMVCDAIQCPPATFPQQHFPSSPLSRAILEHCPGIVVGGWEPCTMQRSLHTAQLQYATWRHLHGGKCTEDFGLLFIHEALEIVPAGQAGG